MNSITDFFNNKKPYGPAIGMNNKKKALEVPLLTNMKFHKNHPQYVPCGMPKGEPHV